MGPALRRTRPKCSGSPRFRSRALGTLGANDVASTRNLSTYERHRRTRPSGCFLQTTSIGSLFSYLEKAPHFLKPLTRSSRSESHDDSALKAERIAIVEVPDRPSIIAADAKP